ncbi:MAG: PilZ domain-containing protein [Kofleriaceae bacterium]
MRVPVRGVALLNTKHATIENLSSSGALFITPLDVFDEDQLRIELKLGLESGVLSARKVRVEMDERWARIAVEFEDVAVELQQAIDAAIEAAIKAGSTKPVLVVDDQSERRKDLVAKLTARGMTPFAPQTPLEAIDLLTRPSLHVNVALLAPHSFDLRDVLSESFPWVTAEEITDVDAAVDAAATAWSHSDVARLATAIA